VEISSGVAGGGGQGEGLGEAGPAIKAIIYDVSDGPYASAHKPLFIGRDPRKARSPRTARQSIDTPLY